jgi:hypothetical protein
VRSSAPELREGLPTEVGHSPELTGIKKAFLAKDFSALTVAEAALRDEQALELQSHSGSASASISPFLITTLALKEEKKGEAARRTRIAEARQQHNRESNSPSDPKHLPRAWGGKRRGWW